MKLETVKKVVILVVSDQIKFSAVCMLKVILSSFHVQDIFVASHLQFDTDFEHSFQFTFQGFIPVRCTSRFVSGDSSEKTLVHLHGTAIEDSIVRLQLISEGG